MNKNIAILCNPHAGSGRSVKLVRDIITKLTGFKIEYSLFIKEWPTGIENFTDIFIVGGDGTLNYYINKYPETALPVFIFKGGTGNDFHWTLYKDISFDEQVEIAIQGTPKPIDLGRCNERYFINGVGIGFEAAITKSLTGKKKLPGKTSFFLSVIKNIFSYKAKFYTISNVNNQLKAPFLLIDIYNGSRAGGGFHVAPKAEADDGFFEIIIANALNPLQRLRYLPVIEKGKHLKLPFINYFRTKEITVKSNSLIQFHLDGEYDEANQLHIRMLDSKIYFRY